MQPNHKMRTLYIKKMPSGQFTYRVVDDRGVVLVESQYGSHELDTTIEGAQSRFPCDNVVLTAELDSKTPAAVNFDARACTECGRTFKPPPHLDCADWRYCSACSKSWLEESPEGQQMLADIDAGTKPSPPNQ